MLFIHKTFLDEVMHKDDHDFVKAVHDISRRYLTTDIRKV